MKTLEQGKDKVKSICKVIHQEALEPAKKESAEIIQSAKKQAEQIVAVARKDSEELINKAKQEIQRDTRAFESSMKQASTQTIALLRQQIETELFNPELQKILTQVTTDAKTVAQMTNAIVEAIEKQGVESDLVAYVSSRVSPKSVNALLLKSVSERLQGGVRVGGLSGGVQVKLVNDHIVIDLSEDALKDMMSRMVKEEFHKALYAAE